MMKKYNLFPPTTNNQISKEYYYSLIGQVNRGTCSKLVQAVNRNNGSYKYITYHLISTM